jgi:hypothetical protein
MPSADRTLFLNQFCHDITLLLDHASTATRRTDHEAADQHARQAVALIERAIRKDYLGRDEAAPIMARSGAPGWSHRSDDWR